MTTLDLLQDLIRNQCVNDGTIGSGQESRSADRIADFLGRGGAIVEPEPGRRSMVFRVEGTDPSAPALALMGHLDVVPVSEAGWSRDPFGAEIDDGFVWGRGAIDMLNQTAAMAVAFKPYLTGELPRPHGDLVLLTVADEEAAGVLGAERLVTDHWDLVRTDYLITEIAYPPIPTPRGLAYPVQVGEKGPHWTLATARGTPGHGSVTMGSDNALVKLARAFGRLVDATSSAQIGPEWREFVEITGMDPGLADPSRIESSLVELAATDPLLAAYVHACTHMTISPNVITSGAKTNVIPDLAHGQIDVRTLQGQGRADVDSYLRAIMGDDVELAPLGDFNANSSVASGPLWSAVRKAIGEVAGSELVVPTLTPATTDARFFRARGVQCFGVGLFDEQVGFGDFLTMFHGNDERVSVASLDLTTRMYQGLLADWATS